MEFGPRTLLAITILAWLDFAMCAVSTVLLIVETFVISTTLGSEDFPDESHGHTGHMNTTTPPGHTEIDIVPAYYGNIASLVIKIFYFIILFLLAETLLAAYLIRALRRKNVKEMKIWWMIMFVVALLYCTEMIATLHSMAILEDVPLSLSIFVKVPLLILVYKYHQHLVNEYGRNLDNVSSIY